jgi:hypothetical protein
MRTRLVMSMTIAALLMSGVPAIAHHSFSAVFDRDKPIEVTGTISVVEWANPHVWFYVDVESDSGVLENWGFELGSVNALIRRGWNRNDLQVGQLVTIVGVLARQDPFTGAVRTITLSNGEQLFGAEPQ